MSEWDGVPPNPEQSGWHWLQEGKRDPQPFEWCSGFKNWWLGGDEDYGGGWQPTAKRYRYLGPVATPEETAAQAARIEELEAALRFYADEENWRRNGQLDPDSGNFTGGPARAALAGGKE